jgi:hypothetical protein
MTKARDIADLGDSIINDANNNVALGDGALDDASLSGSNNVAIGEDALAANTTGSFNISVGGNSLKSNTTAQFNTSVGHNALQAATTSGYNTAVGTSALFWNTAASNVGVGYASLNSNTTGGTNTAVGTDSLRSNTTASNNTAVGYQAGYSGTTGTGNTFLGNIAGYHVTTGSNNTIIGRYQGNQNGLDIRTSSNNIVLSDGDGNVRLRIASGGNISFGSQDGSTDIAGGKVGLALNGSDGLQLLDSRTNSSVNTYRYRFYNTNGLVGFISTNGSATLYSTSSDHRLKENVVELTGATDRLKQLEPKRFNFIADADTTVDGFIAHEVQSVVPEAISGEHNEVDADGNPVYQGIDQSKLVPLLVATIKELEARITALEAN